MGVFNKLKSIFYDEVVVEDETQELDKVSKIVRKETAEKDDAPKVEELKFKTVEMDPIKEEKEEVVEEEKTVEEKPLSDRDLFRSERTFNFVDWDNDDDVDKTPQRKNVLDEPTRVVRSTEPARDNDTPKVFKPTPIISPIWGVLDKDYKKDEIKEKPLSTESFTSSITDYDNVRRKAYGSLEDQLEDTFNKLNKVTTKDINKELKKELVEIEREPEPELEPEPEVQVVDTRTAKIEDLIDKIDEATDELDKTMSIEEAESNVKIKGFDDEEEETPEVPDDRTLTDSTLEHDLFNLIDSMYDKEE